MKGLLIKDMRFLWQQKKIFLAIFAFSILLSLEQSFTYAVSYLTFVYAFLVMSSLSYDEADNGYAFLFTLPVGRSRYVAEKYILSLIATGVSAAMGILIAVVVCMGRGEMETLVTGLAEALIIVPVMLFFLALFLPLQIKYGAEKGRILVVAVFGCITLGGYAAMKFAMQHDIDVGRFLGKLLERNIFMTDGVLLLVSLVAAALSCFISISIMNKKEF